MHIMSRKSIFRYPMNIKLDPVSVSKSDVGDLLQSLDTQDERGLTVDLAEKRLREYGSNVLAEKKKKGIFRIVTKELTEPMIIILIIIALIYSFIGTVGDSLTIVAIVMIVMLLEVFNINRAQKSMESLRSLTSLTSVVYRGGRTVEVKSRFLVPGDIVILSAGDRIPADGRLIDSYNVNVDESSLTGESFPVRKDYLKTGESSLIAELPNFVFSGTLMVQGTARMVVTGTGRRTEIGKISEMVEEVEEAETPLEKSMDGLAFVLAIVAAFFSILIPLIGYFEGQSLDLMIITGLSLAFATVPEELPIVISVTLAVGAYALSRKKAIVRNLRAAETLGDVTVIATDKTGTITENRMFVGHTYFSGTVRESDEVPPKAFIETGVLCTGTLLSDVRVSSKYKDPMEVAVLAYANSTDSHVEALRKRLRVEEEFGFDNRIKMSSYIYSEDGKFSIYVSGAPEVIVANSSSILEDEHVKPIDLKDIERITETVSGFTQAGERIIAISFRHDINPSLPREELEKDLTFAGLMSFVDPPRPEVKESISLCQKAGIRVIMLTGDHPGTARSIAAKVGIDHGGEVLTGADVQHMSDGELSSRLKNVSIFARITSEDKLRIVNLLEQSGEVVAVTGDGVNDSPALRTAQIGISMGIRGTDAAKESSDMILIDDDFSTIVDAVREGRKIFHTLRKGVKYYLTVKMSLVAIFLVPLILSIPFPFSPIQIIVIELFMDVAALGGFVSERGESGLMKKPPRGTDRKFMDSGMWKGIILGSAGLVIAVLSIYLYSYFISANIVEAQTAAFATWVLAQVFLAQNLRTENEPVLRKGFFSNRIIVYWAVGVILALVVITLFPDLQVLLSTASLTPADWVLIVAAALVSTFWMEAVKLIKFRKERFVD